MVEGGVRVIGAEQRIRYNVGTLYGDGSKQPVDKRTEVWFYRRGLLTLSLLTSPKCHSICDQRIERVKGSAVQVQM